METNDELCSGNGYCVESVRNNHPEAHCECDDAYIFTGKVKEKNACLAPFFCPNCGNGTGMCIKPIEPVDNEGNVNTEGICSCDPGRH